MTDQTLEVMRLVASGAIAPEAAAELVRTLGQTDAEPATEPQPPATSEQSEPEQPEQLTAMERMVRAYREAA